MIKEAKMIVYYDLMIKKRAIKYVVATNNIENMP